MNFSDALSHGLNANHARMSQPSELRKRAKELRKKAASMIAEAKKLEAQAEDG